MFTHVCGSHMFVAPQVFFMGQSLVLYPMFPLIDVTCNSLQPLCVQALTRMFRVFDVDNDGLLSDSELNAFQNSCFGVSLLPEDVAGLKKIIAKGGSGMLSSGEGGSVESGDLNAMSAQVLTEDEEEGTREGMFTLKGFLSIIKMFIEKNQLQVRTGVQTTKERRSGARDKGAQERRKGLGSAGAAEESKGARRRS